MGDGKKTDKTDISKEIPAKNGYSDFSESVNHGNREETIVNTNPPPRKPPQGRDKENED